MTCRLFETLFTKIYLQIKVTNCKTAEYQQISSLLNQSGTAQPPAVSSRQPAYHTKHSDIRVMFKELKLRAVLAV